MASKFRNKIMSNGPSKNVIDKRIKYGGGSTLANDQSRNLGNMMQDELDSLIRVHALVDNPKTRSTMRKRMDQLTAPNHRIRTSRLK